MFFRLMAAASLAALVAGCSSEGTEEQLEEFDDTDDVIGSLGVTPVNEMPTSGAATYDGVAFVEYNYELNGQQDDTATGDLELVANFGTGTVTGEIDDMVSDDFNELDGELDITGGTITGNGFGADVNGTVEDQFGLAEVTIDGTMDGTFYGSDAEGVAGTLAGTATAFGETFSASGEFNGLD